MKWVWAGERGREYGGARGRPPEAGGTTLQGEVPATTDSGEYREGTVKSTPARGVKEILKPRTCKQSEGGDRKVCLRACLLKNEPASVCTSRG